MALEFWKKMKASLEQPMGVAAPPPTVESSATANPIATALGALEAARKSALSYNEQSRTEQIHEEQRQAALAKELKLTELHQGEMLEDILKLHAELGTGFSKPNLDKFSDDLRASTTLFGQRNTDSLADQGLMAILHTVHDEALKYGWKNLSEKLAAANKTWPAPLGVSPNATEEELRFKSALYVQRQEKEFLDHNLLVLANIIQGSVPAWRSVYPERHGAVWTSTCYQAVGGAYAAKRHDDILDIAQENLEEIRRTVAPRLTDALKPIEDELKKGVTSLSQARMLSEDAGRVSQKIAIEVFWQVVSPHMQEAPATV